MLEKALEAIARLSGVSSIIVGTINPVHLKENVETLLEVFSHRRSEIP